MRNIKHFTEEEQLDILNSEYYYYCPLYLYDKIEDLDSEENAFIVGQHCISKYPLKNIKAVKDEVYPIFIINCISNISENVELKAVRRFCRYKTTDATFDFKFKFEYLKSLLKHKKSKELHYKLKNVIGIIK